MFTPLTVALLASLGLLSVMAAVLTVRGRPIDNPTFAVTALVEVLLVAQLVLGIVHRDAAAEGMSLTLFVSYLAGLVVVPPAAFLWAVADRESRWGTGVLSFAGLGMLVMVGRVLQIWNGQG